MWVLLWMLVAVVTSHPHGKDRDVDTVEKKFFAVRNKIAIAESGVSDQMMTPREVNLLTTAKFNRDSKPLEFYFRTWSNNVIPVEFDSAYTAKEVQTIRQALNELESMSCFRFPQRRNEEDYVAVEKGNACRSYFGRIGGRQSLLLGETCVHREIVQHEFMHAVGFSHEHQRADRDQHLIVKWNNIDPAKFKEFEKSKYQGYGRPYTYNSIMHYNDRIFSVAPYDGEHPTMGARLPGIEVGDHGMTNEDVLRLRSVGKCEGAAYDWPRNNEDYNGIQNRAILSDDCIDTKSTCRKYALDGYCGHKESAELMAKLCPNSCKPHCLPK